MKNRYVVILLVLLLFCLTGCHTEEPQFWGSYTAAKTYSYDRRYYAIQTVVNQTVDVSVFETNTDKKIDSFSPARSSDFWGICWEKDTYNIWTQSADNGTCCYEYKDDKWIRNESVKEPNYIISRYNEEYTNNEELQRSMYKSPTE